MSGETRPGYDRSGDGEMRLDDEGWLDVSLVIEDGMVTWPGDPEFRMQRVREVSAGDSSTLSEVAMSLHTGTHIDAPAHFIDDALMIDAMPLEAGIGRARLLELVAPDVIRRADLEPHKIGSGERILLKTRNSQLWDRAGFQEDFVALAEDAAEYLAETEVRLVGIDYLSIGPKGAGTAVHRALLSRGVWVVEGLDFRRVEPGDYDLICVPLRFEGGEASPVRAAIRAR